MERDSKGRRLVSLVRVIEYHGTDEWLQQVMTNSRIPFQGELKAGDGQYVRSGIVNWDIIKEGDTEGRAEVVLPPPGGVSH